MDHRFGQAVFIALVCVAMKMQQQASVCWLSIYLCVDLCSVLNYLNADKGDLVVNRKLHRKRQAGVEAAVLRVVRKSVAASVLGILTKESSTCLLYNVGITPFAGKIVFKMAKEDIGH